MSDETPTGTSGRPARICFAMSRARSSRVGADDPCWASIEREMSTTTIASASVRPAVDLTWENDGLGGGDAEQDADGDERADVDPDRPRAARGRARARRRAAASDAPRATITPTPSSASRPTAKAHGREERDVGHGRAQ